LPNTTSNCTGSIDGTGNSGQNGPSFMRLEEIMGENDNEKVGLPALPKAA